MYAADPRHEQAGTKSGSRRLFAEEGVRTRSASKASTTSTTSSTRSSPCAAADPSLTEVIVKLDEGVSGDGNALVELGAVLERATASARDPSRGRRDAARGRRPEARGVRRRGSATGVASSRRGSRATPSRARACRCASRRSATLEILSTHDQLLGGHDGQSYVGCVFPADPGYARAITREAATVGRRLARRRRHRAVRRRLRRRFATTTVRGSATRSRSTCGRVARRTPSSRCSSSPTAITTLSPRPSPRRRARGSASWRATGWSHRRSRPRPRRSVRHRGASWAGVRPVERDRRRVPHDGVARRRRAVSA